MTESNDDDRNRIYEFKQNQLKLLEQEKQFILRKRKTKSCYGLIKSRPEEASYGGILVTFKILPCLEKGEDEPKVPFTQGTPVSVGVMGPGVEKIHIGVVIQVR